MNSLKIFIIILCWLLLPHKTYAQYWSDRTSSIGRTGDVGERLTFTPNKIHLKAKKAGQAIILVEPNKWNAIGDFGELQLGDPNHYIRGEFKKGMTFYDYDKFQFLNGNVNIGTEESYPQFKLTVNGKVKASEIQLDVKNGADYVFDMSYQLLPLRELERFIEQNHHLPNIPSEQQLKSEGLSLGEMSNHLLAKIEELTLYIIDQDKRIKELEDKLGKKIKD